VNGTGVKPAVRLKGHSAKLPDDLFAFLKNAGLCTVATPSFFGFGILGRRDAEAVASQTTTRGDHGCNDTTRGPRCSAGVARPVDLDAFTLEIAGVISYFTVVHHGITQASAPIPPATLVHPIRIPFSIRQSPRVRLRRCCSLS
jgi:hypothetical protein